MEALALMLIHLLTPGGLHWTRNGVPRTDEAHDRLMREKSTARPEDLCRGLPPVFEDLLRYCRRLDFPARPDYEHWIGEFRELADEYGFGDVEEFVWPSPFPKVRTLVIVSMCEHVRVRHVGFPPLLTALRFIMAPAAPSYHTPMRTTVYFKHRHGLWYGIMDRSRRCV